MLVLSRRNSEEIVIDDRIRVKVLGTNGSRVRLGIEAPDEVPVHRGEVYRDIQQEVLFEFAERVT